jgi:dUTP pyrophosphatase
MIQILKSGSHPIPPQGSDIGYDLVAVSEPVIVGERNEFGDYDSIQYIEYDTGVKLCGENPFLVGNLYSLVYPRSSISKYNLVIANSVGVIDAGFIDSIKVRFKYVFQPGDLFIKNHRIVVEIDFSKIYKKGDKIAQLIFAAKFDPQIEFVDELTKTQRGTGGFGSTGE